MYTIDNKNKKQIFKHIIKCTQVTSTIKRQMPESIPHGSGLIQIQNLIIVA